MSGFILLKVTPLKRGTDNEQKKFLKKYSDFTCSNPIHISSLKTLSGLREQMIYFERSSIPFSVIFIFTSLLLNQSRDISILPETTRKDKVDVIVLSLEMRLALQRFFTSVNNSNPSP